MVVNGERTIAIKLLSHILYEILQNQQIAQKRGEKVLNFLVAFLYIF